MTQLLTDFLKQHATGLTAMRSTLFSFYKGVHVISHTRKKTRTMIFVVHNKINRILDLLTFFLLHKSIFVYIFILSKI